MLVKSLAIFVVLAALLLQGSDRSFASDPCSGLPEGTPINNPEPDVGGAVTENVNSHPPIQGATLELFKCVSGTGVSHGTDTTDSSGIYEFAGVDEDEWYYVEALITGPLAGMVPSSGTSNPSQAVWVGPDADVDFEFED